MTSAAGNFDDGQNDDGALVTVGGVGDSTANPSDPFDSTTTNDDELYTLSPFLANGDTQITLETANPSDDDSIFVAVIYVSGNAGVASLFTDLGTVGGAFAPAHSTENDLTLTTSDEDWYRVKAGTTGDLVATIDFQPDGSGLVLAYRDSDADGLPDDLTGDGVPDPVGTATATANRVRISNIPGVVPGDLFLVRVFAPTGQVQYNIDLKMNNAPTATGDNYSTNEDTTLTVAAPGVLVNDSDPDGQSLTAEQVSGRPMIR